MNAEPEAQETGDDHLRRTKEVIGYHLDATDGRVVGKVDDLIVDTATMKVRYFDVELRHSTPHRNAADRHILLPVSYARLGDAERCVTLDAPNPNDLGRLPPFAALPVTTHYDEEFRTDTRGGSSRGRRA